MEYLASFKSLPDNEKIKCIEICFPGTSAIRVLDQNIFTEQQCRHMWHDFTNSIDQEQGLHLDQISVHDSTYIVYGKSSLNNEFEATGYYSDGSFLFIEDLELIKKATTI